MHKILIADDCAPIRRLLRSFFESHAGFKVSGEAADGAEAVAKALKLDLDVIVLDLSMPRMNGLEAAIALRKTVPKVPIILFTLHKNTISNSKARDAGITAIVSKTDGLGVLFEEVQRLVSAT